MPIDVYTLQKFPNRVFVETGTFKGNTIRKAFSIGFEKCYTVELEPERFNEVKRALKSHVDDHSLTMHMGNSPDCLPLIMAEIDEPVTFWLDAHSNTYAPLYEELDIIANHHIKTHTILIDDVRCWEKNFRNVTKKGIIEAVMKVNPNYVITYENGHIPNDVMAATLA